MNTETSEKYKDYTLALALFDGVPVALFFANGLLIYSHFKRITGNTSNMRFKSIASKLFLGGVISAFIGGASKVVWKIIVVRDKKDVEALTKAFHALLPAGMTVMIVSGAAGLVSAAKQDKGSPAGKGSPVGLAGKMSPKTAGLLAAGTAGMGLMGYLGRHMDSSARSNWIEEAVNATSQAAFLAATVELTGRG